MSNEQGADHRRSIYGFSRDLKKTEVINLTEARVKTLLEKSAETKDPEKKQGIMGDVWAVFMEAQAALDRLDQGRVR